MADDGEYNISRARICIDFGTALSKASICLDPTLPLEVGVRPLPIGVVSGAEHPLLTPSVLFVSGGRLYFGPTAFEHARAGVATGGEPLLSFKTVLGAQDVDAALATKLRPSVDPTNTFTQRNALALYLAYLDQLIREALRRGLNLPPAVINAKRRYTSPVWKPGGGVDHALESIFNEAAAISAKLGPLLLSPEGISIAQCKDALDKAAAAPGNANLETGVFEPHAAAAAAYAFMTEPSLFVMVVDIGAGTTDIAAFGFDEKSDPPALSEVKEARRCSSLAGDEIDHILVELFARKRGGEKTSDEELRNLRATKLLARQLKQELFTQGRCALKHGWLSTTVKIEELLEDPTFREYQLQLAHTIAASLSVVIARADAAHAPMIDVVLAGGGSHLPFLPDLVRAAAQGRGQAALRIGPLSPANALYDNVDPALGGAFPQIAMSIGGALVEILPPN